MPKSKWKKFAEGAGEGLADTANTATQLVAMKTMFPGMGEPDYTQLRASCLQAGLEWDAENNVCVAKGTLQQAANPVPNPGDYQLRNTQRVGRMGPPPTHTSGVWRRGGS